MRESDWRQGRGRTGAAVAAGGVGVLAALIVTMVVMVRRRRRAFGQLRPEVAIVAVKSKRKRRGVGWQVAFADRSRTTYGDSARLRQALLDRSRRDLSVEISPGDRQLLGTAPDRAR